MNAFVFEDFLVGVFYSVLMLTMKKWKNGQYDNPDYIQSFELQEQDVALITQYRSITSQTFESLKLMLM